MSAKVLTKAAAKEAKIDLIEDGRGTQAVHDVVVAMRAARRLRAQAARLLEKDFKISAASCLSQGPERADQGRRRISDRQICRAGTENEIVCGVIEKTNRRPENFANFGCV